MNPCAWFLSDLSKIPSTGITVMSTFSCGGGSSMGYKLAGCNVVAANDIDPEMAYHYKLNLNPSLYFLCPIRSLLTEKLPSELFDLDILDGSPPCSTFSMSGDREKTWGKNKKFREGQATQVLSDLFFDYLDLVDRLRPKVAIAENVKGMILGNAKGYTKLVFQRFKELGYTPQLFLVNAADCGVPQRRERVFFCAARNDLKVPPLALNPNHSWISAGSAIADLRELSNAEWIDAKPTKLEALYWKHTKPGNSLKQGCFKVTGKESWFNSVKLHPGKPSCTLLSKTTNYSHWSECRRITFREWKRLGSFPDDYQAKTDSIGKYMVGMSVPPRMTEAVAKAVINQWLTAEGG